MPSLPVWGAIAAVSVATAFAVSTPVWQQLGVIRSLPDPMLASAHVQIFSKGGGHGSGVSIGNGYILTAAHVAKSEGLRIKDDLMRVQDMEVLWLNESYDIALVRAKRPELLASAELDCAPNAIGQEVTAFGNPLNIEFVRTGGSVMGTPISVGPWRSVVPVDMTIIPGQSGGGVMNEAGEVVGITVGVMTAGFSITGIGLVVPAESICSLMGRTA